SCALDPPATRHARCPGHARAHPARRTCQRNSTSPPTKNGSGGPGGREGGCREGGGKPKLRTGTTSMANSDVDECPTPSRNVLPYQSLSVTVQMLDETDLRAPTSTRPLDLEVGAVLAETQHQWDACRTEHESRPTLPTRRGCPALAGQLPCSSRGIDWILGWLPPALPDTPKRTRSQTRSEREDGTCKLEVLGRGSGAFTSRRVGDVGVLRSPSPARLYSSSPDPPPPACRGARWRPGMTGGAPPPGSPSRKSKKKPA
ncbi:unnamed protein product, partial [Prorocentrum cordatum]